MFGDSYVNLFVATSICKKNNSTLATVSNREENDFIKHM